MQRVVARVRLGVHGLDARRVVDVGDRRDVGARHVELVDAEQALLLVASSAMRRARAHRRHQQHVRAVAVELEVLARRARAAPLGANGRKHSRYLIFRFITDCIFGERASPRMLRPPSARGPNSIRPWNQPDDLLLGEQPRRLRVAHRSSRRSARRRAPAAVERRLDLVVAKAGPEVRALHARRASPRRRARSLPSTCVPDARAPTPSAPPASPAAGWIQMSLERPLAQQPAVGDAVERHAAGQAEVLAAGLAVRRGAPCAARSPRSPPGSSARGPSRAA